MVFLKKLSAVRFAGKVNWQHQRISLLDDFLTVVSSYGLSFLVLAAQISSVLL